MRFNGDTATNYSDTHLYGHASGVHNGSGRNTSLKSDVLCLTGIMILREQV
jgi:hypothetical protein